MVDFNFEKKLWKKGIKVVAGADEVGRGCFAGPIVAGCVVFPKLLATDYQLPVKIDDSKKLTAKQRERADKWIRENALAWGVGEASPALINRIGMAKATKLAFRKAIKNCQSKFKSKIDHLLIDAFFIPYTRGIRRRNQLAIVNGDEKSFSVAAASIVAKVYRDKLMTSLSKQSEYKSYKWEKNKGYGTKDHQAAIVKYGITRYHRKGFIITWSKKHAGATGTKLEYAGKQ